LEAGADHTALFLEKTLSDYPGEWHFWDDFRPGALLAG
jgi:hypothetical protein